MDNLAESLISFKKQAKKKYNRMTGNRTPSPAHSVALLMLSHHQQLVGPKGWLVGTSRRVLCCPASGFC